MVSQIITANSILFRLLDVCFVSEQYALLSKNVMAIGEAWAVLAHCYVMTDELNHAYHAYQNALAHLANPDDPNLWYGIGLLYDRFGSLEHALEAFLTVLEISPDFERVDEVCFCIGIIYKEQKNYDKYVPTKTQTPLSIAKEVEEIPC